MKENEFYHGPIFPRDDGIYQESIPNRRHSRNFRFEFRRSHSQGFQKIKNPGKIQTFFDSSRDGSDAVGRARTRVLPPIPILQLSCMCVHAYSFEIIYIHNLSSKFLYSPQLLRRSDVVEVLAGVVTSMFDFFHIIKPPFFIFF